MPERKRFKITREDPAVRRGAMIDATLRCLEIHGAGGISVRKIAQEAGVSAGLVAHHFGGVETLIALSYRAIAARIGRIMEDAALAAGPDPHAQLLGYVTASFRPPVLDPSLLATWVGFWGLTKSSAAVASAHREIYADYRAVVERLLRLCGGGDKDVRLTAVAITALVDGLWLELCLDDSVFTAGEARDIAERGLAALLQHAR